MKKSLLFLSSAFLLTAMLLSGCNKPSVKEVNPNCVSSYMLMNGAIASDPIRTKRDLDGKVIEIWGTISKVRRLDKYKTPRVEFEANHERDNPYNIEQVVCTIKNGTDPKFISISPSRDGAVVRGYGEVVYDKVMARYVLLLHEAEIVQVLKNVYYDPAFSDYLKAERPEWYSAGNRQLWPSPNKLSNIRTSLKRWLPFI